MRNCSKKAAGVLLSLGFLMVFSSAVVAEDAPDVTDAPDARTILTKATGGDEWANAKTLLLKGRAVFWGKAGAAPTSSPDSYVM